MGVTVLGRAAVSDGGDMVALLPGVAWLLPALPEQRPQLSSLRHIDIVARAALLDRGGNIHLHPVDGLGHVLQGGHAGHEAVPVERLCPSIGAAVLDEARRTATNFPTLCT